MKRLMGILVTVLYFGCTGSNLEVNPPNRVDGSIDTTAINTSPCTQWGCVTGCWDGGCGCADWVCISHDPVICPEPWPCSTDSGN